MTSERIESSRADGEHPAPGSDTVFVARQPVFGADGALWGYELLFRPSGQEGFDDTRATSSMVADGFALAAESVTGTPFFLVNFAEDLLLDGTATLLPPERCVVEVLEFVRPRPEIVEAVADLKARGYRIAVDDYTGQEELRPFLDLADIVKVGVLALDCQPHRILSVLEGIPANGPTLLAEKVEDCKTAEILRQMGFELFQGYYFSKPELVPGKKPSTSQMTRLQLMQELGKDSMDTNRLVEILQTEAALSYRLFRYINSAGFSLRQKINSLNRAVTYLGQRQTAQWLRAAILSEMVCGPTAAELALMAVQRARFFELLAENGAEGCIAPESSFILGLFSLLDALMGSRMADILAPLPLEDDIVRALTGDNPGCPMLGMAACYEYGDWQGVAERAARMKLEVSAVDAMYQEAREWAQGILGSAECSAPE